MSASGQSGLTRPACGGLVELASALAKGYLRLTQKVRNSAVSVLREPQKELDLPARESPHHVGTVHGPGEPHGNQRDP